MNTCARQRTTTPSIGEDTNPADNEAFENVCDPVECEQDSPPLGEALTSGPTVTAPWLVAGHANHGAQAATTRTIRALTERA